MAEDPRSLQIRALAKLLLRALDDSGGGSAAVSDEFKADLVALTLRNQSAGKPYITWTQFGSSQSRSISTPQRSG
jgi:hypothetical protein